VIRHDNLRINFNPNVSRLFSFTCICQFAKKSDSYVRENLTASSLFLLLSFLAQKGRETLKREERAPEARVARTIPSSFLPLVCII